MLTIPEFINLHLLILLFSNYNIIIAKKNMELYKNLKDLFINRDLLIKYIKRTVMHVCIEELFFRVYLNEFLEYFIDISYLQLVSSLCFSLGHIVNYYQLKQLKMHNIRMTINQVIYTFILSNYYLQPATPLMSLVYHQYTNLCCIAINYYNYK
jgi:membrane protease YdiL (CAAX protease family)